MGERRKGDKDMNGIMERSEMMVRDMKEIIPYKISMGLLQ
jgi:hypothetical protein